MTIRGYIYNVNKRTALWSLVLGVWLLTLGGCASGKKASWKKSQDGELTLTTLDVSQDQRPDTWRWTKPGEDGQPETLVREEMDLNFDGKVDLTKWFETGIITRTAMDLDFDGQVDITEYFAEGVLARSEGSHTFSGITDTWRFYEEGKLLRLERDTNGDGKPDVWRYYEKDQLQRVARDLDFDGIVDTWEE